MKALTIRALAVLLTLSYSYVYAQEKATLYYDENGKGLDTKKKATFYRTVTFDQEGKPLGLIEDFYLNGKPLASGEASIIDKFDNNNSRWKGPVTNYDEKGKLSGKNNYDSDGNLDGIQMVYNSDGIKTQELEYLHGNPTKDYYLVFDKTGNTTRYSYLSRLPMRLATTDKKIVPITERKVIYQNDQPVQFYFKDGLSVAVKLSTKQLYGNYYEAFITIENGSGAEFTFDPSNITSSLEKADEVDEAEVLTYAEYIKKVNRRQKWTAAFTAFAEVAAATSAGYSSSVTNASARTSTGKSVHVNSSTTSYNGAAQYAAAQNAGNNISQLVNQQYDIRQTISEGYLKKNTIFPNSRIVGFINIKQQAADHILLNVPVNGKVYHFEL
jgi:hypothetical protein